MSRSDGERLADVMHLVGAAREVVSRRAQWADEIARTTGLSPEGVELGFTRHLEIDATEADVARLVADASRFGDPGAVYVILSANVFVAPLRAIAIARAASARVVVRPSRREPTFARALAFVARDPAITLASDVAYVRSNRERCTCTGATRRSRSFARARPQAWVCVATAREWAWPS